MDDRFKINKYNATSLIILGIGMVFSFFQEISAVGTIISFIGAVGFFFSSNPDKVLISGFFIWGIGVIDVIMHWPGGELIILVGGILTLIALFIRFGKDKFSNFKLWILLSLLILFAAYYLKVLNYDFSIYVFILGTISLVISYGLRFLNKKQKNNEDYFKLLFIYSIVINYLFLVGSYPGSFITQLVLILSVFALGVFSIIKYFPQSHQNHEE